MSEKLKKVMDREDYILLNEMAKKYADGNIISFVKFLDVNTRNIINLTFRVTEEEKNLIDHKLNEVEHKWHYYRSCLKNFMEEDGMKNLSISPSFYKAKANCKICLSILEPEEYNKIKEYSQDNKLPISTLLRIAVLKDIGYSFD